MSPASLGLTSPWDEVRDRLARVEDALRALAREAAVKEWYSTAEVAALVGRAEYTVREWCRQGRVRAAKGAHARGPHPEWRVGRDEVERVRNHGLLPPSSAR